MADNTLVNRYKQYKAGTTKLANWLANAARNCQDVTSILPSLRAAKDAAKRSKRNHKHEGPLNTNVTVTTSQLLKLAKIVVDSSTAIPEDIIHTTKTVIAGRQVCSNLYLSFPDPADATADEQNKGHQHFIDVLKQIKQLLESSRNIVSAAKTSKQSHRNTPNGRSGTQVHPATLFSRLQLDEPGDNPLGSAPLPKHSDKKVTFELEDSEHEKSFAIWCLLQDIRDLRREVQIVWQDYKSGKISFSSAIMISELAIHMTRFAEAEFTEQYPDLRSHTHIYQYMGLNIFQVGRDISVVSINERISVAMERMNLNNSEITELLTPRAYALMMALSNTIAAKLSGPAGDLQAETKFFFGYHRFGYILQSLLPDLDGHNTPNIEMTRLAGSVAGFCGFATCPGSAPTITLVTSCQINMDIVDVIGADFDVGLSEHQLRLEADQASIYKFLRKWNLKCCCTDETSLVGNALRVKKLLADIARDAYSEPRNGRAKSHTIQETSSSAFSVYRALPLIPGMFINISAMQTRSIGIMLCNWGNIVISAAYLYRATLRSGGLTKAWPDMDFVVKTHSKVRPLVLEPETETGNIAKCFGVALGVKGSAYRRGQRPPLPKESTIQQHGRRLSTEWPLGKALGEWDWNGSENYTGWPFVNAAIKSLESLQKQENKDLQLCNLCDQYEKTGKVTPSQLLLCFKAVFIEHEMDMKFDYISFFFTCAKILNTIEREFSCYLRSMEIKREADFTNRHELVYAILWDAVEAYERPEHRPHSILFDVGKILEQIVDEDGAKYSDLARSQTSGYTAIPQLSSGANAEGQAVDSRDFFGLPMDYLKLPSGCTPEEEEELTAFCKELCDVVRNYSGDMNTDVEIQAVLVDKLKKRLENAPIEVTRKLLDRLSRVEGVGIYMRSYVTSQDAKSHTS